MEQEPDFEGERMVIREVEDAKTQKQGWFSKRTKKTSLPPSAASRPPTAASFGSSRRKASSKSQEVDLPPRTDATPSPLPSLAHTDPSNTPVSTERRSSDAAADVPVHAGFDLAAIQHMIGEAERHPELLVVPQPKPDQGASVPPPMFSAPPLSPPIRQARTVTGAVTPVPYDDADEAGTSGRNLPDMSATFTTSLTLHDKDHYRTMDKAREEQREAKLCSVPNNALSRPSYPPEMSPAVWSSPTNALSNTLGNPLAGSTEGLSFGGPSRYLAQPPHAHDRLGTLGAQSTSATSPGLSFGTPDGTITFQGSEPDPWSTPTEFRNPPSNGLGMNPWSM
jgi:hypothetical protein